VWAEIPCGGRSCSRTVACPGRPVELRVDPAFDVLRRLDPAEVAPTLSTVFGADRPTFVVAAAASTTERQAWRDLATSWARPDEPVVVLDTDLEAVPAGPVWILGGANRLADAFAASLASQGVQLTPATVTLGDASIPRAGHSVVAVARSATHPGAAIAWVAADPTAAIPGLARKLPHYTRYSYLAFRGPEPENTVKGTWEALDSPMVRTFDPTSSQEFRLPERKPLGELGPVFDSASLGATVTLLASVEMEGRGLGSAGLERATGWVERQMAAIGLEPAGEDGSFRQSWRLEVGEPLRPARLTNLVGRIPGRDPALAGSPVLMMAHLDHLGRGWPDVRAGNEGLVHPGADDNASGVAVALAVARSLAGSPPPPRPVLVAVVSGEEAGLLGSRHLLASLGEDGAPFACVNLDTVGRLGDGRILVLDAGSAREWRFIFMGVGHTTGAPITVASERLDSSDQGACLELGIPAVQLFTGAHADYHRPSDTADRIDAVGMAVVAEATREAVAYLAQRSEPLTVQIADAPAPAAPRDGATTTRKVALGTVPDFAFPGPGVRIDEVLPGSPAAQAGLRAGDILRAFDGEEVTDLRAYAAVLGRRVPGDAVALTVERDGARLVLTAVLAAR
jgi:aminopeptidase N